MTDTPALTEPAPKQIAIVGFTASHVEAPWGDPEWEVWIENNLWKFVPDQWHRLYDVHNPKEIKADREHDAFLSGATQKHQTGAEVTLGQRPLYCNVPQPDWPTSQKFPREDLEAMFGRYFNNSISWMVAHALMEIRAEARKFADYGLAAMQTAAEDGAGEFFDQVRLGLDAALIHEYEARCHIHIYGVDMATSGEYGGQRPSCEHMLGIATGRGVKVHVPLSSDLLKVTALYGVEDDSPLFAKCAERENELVQRGRQLEQQLESATAQIHRVQGALETTRYFKSVWCNPRGTREASTAAPSPERDGSAKEPTPGSQEPSRNGQVDQPEKVLEAV